MTIDRTPTKRVINLAEATSAEITTKHCYVTINGHRYRSENRTNNGTGSRSDRGTAGDRPMTDICDAQRQIIADSFARFPSVDITTETDR